LLIPNSSASSSIVTLRESVAEEVCTSRFHNSLLAELVLSIARRRFLWAFHVNVVLLPMA